MKIFSDIFKLIRHRKNVLMFMFFLYSIALILDFSLTLIATHLGYSELSPITVLFLNHFGAPINLIITYIIMMITIVVIKPEHLLSKLAYYPLLIALGVLIMSHIAGFLPFLLNRLMAILI